MRRTALAALCLVPCLLSFAAPAAADEPPLPASTATAPPPGYGQPPPPGYGQPPPGYGQPPPPGYYPQPGYAPPPQDNRPRILDYDDGMEIPKGYHLRSKVRGGLIGGGAGMLGALWVVSVIVGAVANAAHATTVLGGDGRTDLWTPMYFPVAGPFVTMATASTDLSSGGLAFLAIDGLIQVGGAAMITLGIALPKKQLVRDDLSKTFSITPTIGANGFGFSGTF